MTETIRYIDALNMLGDQPGGAENLRTFLDDRTVDQRFPTIEVEVQEAHQRSEELLEKAEQLLDDTQTLTE